MNDLFSFIKAGIIGLVMGGIGAVVGFLPILFIKSYIGYFGFPLPWNAIIIVPIGGAFFGLMGATFARLSGSSQTWLWGGIAGLLFNFCVSFWAQ